MQLVRYSDVTYLPVYNYTILIAVSWSGYIQMYLRLESAKSDTYTRGNRNINSCMRHQFRQASSIDPIFLRLFYFVMQLGHKTKYDWLTCDMREEV